VNKERDGSLHVPVFLLSFHEETMIGCDHVLANEVNTEIPLRNRNRPFGDYLIKKSGNNNNKEEEEEYQDGGVHDDFFSLDSDRFHQPEFLPLKHQRNGVMDLDGETAVAIGDKFGLDTVIAVQSPSTHNEVDVH
jgi:hypothetical protein